MGRGGGCWGGVRRPEPSDLSFWLLVLNCSRWQPREQWPQDRLAVEAGSPVSRPPAALPPAAPETPVCTDGSEQTGWREAVGGAASPDLH